MKYRILTAIVCMIWAGNACTVKQPDVSAPNPDAIQFEDEPLEDNLTKDAVPEGEISEPAELQESQKSERQCPSDRQADALLPRITQEDLNPEVWHRKDGKRAFLDHKSVQQFNERFYDKWSDLDARLTAGEIRQNIRERLDSYRKKFEEQEIMFEDGTVPQLSEFDQRYEEFVHDWPNDADILETKHHLIVEDTPILCAPHDRDYIKTKDGEVRFSRNRCSLGRAQGRIEVIYTHPDGMRFVRTAEMWGWLSASAKLSPEIQANAKHDIYPSADPAKASEKYEDARWFTTRDIDVSGQKIPKGAFLAGNDKYAWIGTASGFSDISKNDAAFANGGLVDTHRALTWNAWIDTLFLFLDDPYGWGGYGGWRDCSRLLQDTARSFGVHLARNSSHQARKTSYYFNVEGMASEDKIRAIEDAAKTGIVFLHFKGHIMAWLGRAKDGRPMVLHALSEYLETCENSNQDNPETTLVHTDRVVVSDLLLGEGTKRGNYLERITHVSVITDMSAGMRRGNKTTGWTPQEETLYAAFIERLFDYEDLTKSWNNLGDILRDKEHNILYNALGMHEDDKLKLQPDCADLPYALRGYFAWKRGLPMAVRKCSRGTEAKAPRCNAPEIYINHAESAEAFRKYIIQVTGYQVHSGNARTLNDDDNTDFYPVELTRQSLRPGTTFADPHGHILMIAHYSPDTAEVPGALYSVDAQPDGTITRKRFWRGNFLFDPNITNVGAGFKAFRPVVCSRKNASDDDGNSSESNCYQLNNEELNASSGFVPYSQEQLVVSGDEFYDRVEAAIHPKPLSIDDSIKELSDALYESAHRRLENVQNGDDYIREHGPSQMIMPNGYAVFETTGPWEDFATPSRDMRLLIAMDAVLKFPDSIIRNAKRYQFSEEEAKAAAETARERMDQKLATQVIEYPNSDGKLVKVTMLDLLHRVDNFEMAYHPSDCNELRWGAPEGSDEIKTCSRRASEHERQKMLAMRKWFHLRARPPR